MSIMTTSGSRCSIRLTASSALLASEKACPSCFKKRSKAVAIDGSSSTMSISAMVDGEGDAGTRSFWMSRFKDDPPTMSFDNRLGVYQPQAHSFPFGRDERVEYAVDKFRIDPGPIVAYLDHHRCRFDS